ITAGRSKAKAGDHTGRGNRGEQMEALIPANAIAPADISLPGQPAGATPLGIACRNTRTVQRLIQTALRLHLFHQEQTEGHDHLTMLPGHAIELLQLGQGWEGRAQVAHRIAIEGAFTGKLPPLTKYRQRYYLATRQRGRWKGAMFLIEAFRLAKIIDHHV